MKIRGDIGSVLTIVEENIINYDINDWKSFVIDGENYKPNTWYKLNDGNVIACCEE